VYQFIFLLCVGFLLIAIIKKIFFKKSKAFAIRQETVSFDLTFENCEEINPKGHYLFLDIETTGLPIYRSDKPEDLGNWPYIVEIGWLLLDVKGKLIDEGSNFIKQQVKISDFVTSINHITNEMMIKEGIEPKDAWLKIQKAIGNSKELIGHNLAFLLPILQAEFIRAGLQKPLVNEPQFCTQEMGCDFCKIYSDKTMPDYKLPSLEELVKACFFPNVTTFHLSVTHHPEKDVKIVAKCYFKMLEMGVKDYNKPTASTQPV
jgi:DNA polymerase III alpha subunit (gram-positive type)